MSEEELDARYQTMTTQEKVLSAQIQAVKDEILNNMVSKDELLNALGSGNRATTLPVFPEDTTDRDIDIRQGLVHLIIEESDTNLFPGQVIEQAEVLFNWIINGLVPIHPSQQPA